ncbi:MAG: hypothetical protein BWZ02_01288 [Lentisphaerae bacterium ADurb.BinA184]|nr:MAG: hypothetical protein BWZ02_01288 [Lentisphaerae bacterium ADurb.BinA184]
MSVTTYRNKSLRRRRKTASARGARMKTQQKRLVAMGVAEEKVAKLTCADLRRALIAAGKAQAKARRAARAAAAASAK